MKFEYKIGGTISSEHPSYIKRAVDEDLYTNLLQGNFCYVLTSRQMGKSSLTAQVIEKLRQDGIKCSWYDASFAGDKENVTANQWYRGLINRWVNELGLREFVNVKKFWEQREEFTFLERLDEFVNKILFTHISSSVVIFIDEIDSTINLDFTDDFFAWVRYCFNAREENPNYKRLTFCFAGVATPTDLIKDKNRTPFNIGKLIEPLRFQEDELNPLMEGLREQVVDQRRVQHEIHKWTGGQPFLTQRLCKLIQSEVEKIEFGQEEELIAQVVKNKIINNWEYNDEPVHLKTIRDRLLQDENKAISLLGLYRQILKGIELGESIELGDKLSEVRALRLAGLIVSEKGQLFVYNEIYRRVFSAEWVAKELERLRPYAVSLAQWLANDRDDKYLLTGQGFLDAQQWSLTRQLTTEDSQYLASSQKLHTEDFQAQAEEIIRRAKKKATLFTSIGVSGLIASMIASGIAWLNFNEVRWKTQIEQASSEVLSNHPKPSLERTIAAIKVGRELQKKIKGVHFNNYPSHTPLFALRQAIATDYWHEANRFAIPYDHNTASLAISADGKIIVSSTGLELPIRDGPISSLYETSKSASLVSYNDDENEKKYLADKKIVRVWRRDGSLITTFKSHRYNVVSVAISANGQTIVSKDFVGTTMIWSQDGRLIKTISSSCYDYLSGIKTETCSSGHTEVDISDDGQTIILSDGFEIKILSRDGSLIKTINIEKQQNEINRIKISGDGQTIVVLGDNTITIWNRKGSLVKTIKGVFEKLPIKSKSKETISTSLLKTKPVFQPVNFTSKLPQLKPKPIFYSVEVSADGQTIVSGSNDETVRIWRRDGSLVSTLKGHKAEIYSVGVSDDGQTIASSSGQAVKIWRGNGSLLANLTNVNTDLDFSGDARILFASAMVISADGQTIAYGSWDNQLRIWQRDESLISTINRNQDKNTKLSNDGQIFFVVKENRAELRNIDGSLITELDSFQLTPNTELLTISADSQTIIVREDKRKGSLGTYKYTTRIRRKDGSLVASLGDISDARISADGKTIATYSSYGEKIKVWQRDGSLIATLDHNATSGHNANRLAVSADGQTIVSANGTITAEWDQDSTAKVWQRNGSLISTLIGHKAAIYDLAASADGQTIVSGSEDKTVKVWNRDGSLIATLVGHQARVYSVGVSADGQTIVSGSKDKMVKVWRKDGSLIATLPTSDEVGHVSISADGQTIASESRDSIKIWHLNLDRLLDKGCAQIKGYLISHPEVNQEGLCPK
jgi:WD40 repeat protein